MQFAIQSAAAIEADILQTEGPRTVEGIDYATDAGARMARRATANRLAHLAQRVRVAAERATQRLPCATVRTAQLPYTRCAWCADYIERDVRATQTGPFLLHAIPCATDFAAARWQGATSAIRYPAGRARRRRRTG
jgi:hypothetical protein